MPLPPIGVMKGTPLPQLPPSGTLSPLLVKQLPPILPQPKGTPPPPIGTLLPVTGTLPPANGNLQTPGQTLLPAQYAVPILLLSLPQTPPMPTTPPPPLLLTPANPQRPTCVLPGP